MTIIRKGTFTVHFMDSNTEKQFPTLESAMAAAEAYVGNRSYAKPFRDEPTMLYGPGDGTTSVMIREDVDFT